MFQTPTWSVSEITRYLRDLLESDENLQDLWVEGEVSNLSQPSSGHLYFTIKDSGSALRCVMWRNSVIRQTFLPRDGDAIEVHGNISLYEASGHYQLYADLIRPTGEGALYQEFLRLKAQLESEGLFDPQRKRTIPPWPQVIGIVTSPTGAALRDMIRTIKRRYPPIRVVLAPTAVQGDQAPDGIRDAIEALNRVVMPDVILLARGGGSIEDLRAFNDEGVAHAIVDSKAPVVTGIGHETDFTIADFAADLRAATPTAAAELATPDQEDIRQALSALRENILRAMQFTLQTRRSEMVRFQSLLSSRSPMARIRRDRQRLDELNIRGGIVLAHILDIDRARLAGLDLRLKALNPQAILQRGFSIITHLDGEVVRSIQQVKLDDDLKVRVSDGEFGARVQDNKNAEGGKP